MHIPKASYQIKETAHGKGTTKEVILDKTHLPHLLQFATSRFKKGQQLEPHSHESMSEVFFVKAGIVKVKVDNQVFIAEYGDSFYIKAKLIHSFEFLENTEFMYFCLEDYS